MSGFPQGISEYDLSGGDRAEILVQRLFRRIGEVSTLPSPCWASTRSATWR
ncbi:MAG: hypothetical protein JW809_12810 [Pirellulales bacterium]|nr:hypothetical protein [Pirellulales bacterium]